MAITLTLLEVSNLLDTMLSAGADELTLDIETEWGRSVESVDFDIWGNGRYLATVISKEN